MLTQNMPDESLAAKIRSWTPAYIVRRLIYEIYVRRHPDEPWFSRPALPLVREWIRPTDRGFEWGSGRSTIWFARHSQFIASVEHHQGWYNRVSSQIKQHKLTNVDYYFCDIKQVTLETAAQSEYVQAIKQYDESFDYIVVDGIIRDHCAMLAIEYLKPGGLLILDDAHRFIVPPRQVKIPYFAAWDKPVTPTWELFTEQTVNWRRAWLDDGVRNTVLFFKPVA